jgi:hypothetical protein
VLAPQFQLGGNGDEDDEEEEGVLDREGSNIEDDGDEVRKLENFFFVTQVQRKEVKNVCSDNIFQVSPEAVFLVMCDPSMNELLVT